MSVCNLSFHEQKMTSGRRMRHALPALKADLILSCLLQKLVSLPSTRHDISPSVIHEITKGATKHLEDHELAKAVIVVSEQAVSVEWGYQTYECTPSINNKSGFIFGLSKYLILLSKTCSKEPTSLPDR